MELTTLEKTKKLIKYLKSTNKTSGIEVFKKIKTKDWDYVFYINGFYNKGYFSVDITKPSFNSNIQVKIANGTDNFLEINNLLAKYGLKEKI